MNYKRPDFEGPRTSGRAARKGGKREQGDG